MRRRKRYGVSPIPVASALCGSPRGYSPPASCTFVLEGSVRDRDLAVLHGDAFRRRCIEGDVRLPLATSPRSRILRGRVLDFF
jgi:hypothetical protein